MGIMEKVLSILTPVGVTLSILISKWLLLLSPVGLYYLFKKFELKLPKEVALKLFDFSLSLLIMLFVFGLIHSGLLVVAKDADVLIPLVSSGLAKQMVALLTIAYYLICMLMFIVFAFRGKTFNPPLSMKIFETIRGKK